MSDEGERGASPLASFHPLLLLIALSASLNRPQAFQLHGALGMCLFGLASLANVFELVCRLPNDTFSRLVRAYDTRALRSPYLPLTDHRGLMVLVLQVTYAISLLRCPQEGTQKSVVLFFHLALAFRPVLEAFDADPSQVHHSTETPTME